MKINNNPSEVYSKIIPSNFHRPFFVLGGLENSSGSTVSCQRHHEFHRHPPVPRWKSPCHTAHQHLAGTRDAEEMEGPQPLQRLPRGPGDNGFSAGEIRRRNGLKIQDGQSYPSSTVAIKFMTNFLKILIQ